MIRLDVGCGGQGTKYPGFIGIDKYVKPEKQRTPGAEYVQIDFVYNARLPWEPESIDEIICLHVIEHLMRFEGLILLNRIWQLLKPGAKAYVSCPDTKLFAQKYVEGDRPFFSQTYPKNGKKMWPGRTTLDRFFYSMRDELDYGHRTPYDLETLIDTAKQAGCEQVEQMPKTHKWYNDQRYEIGIIITK